MKIKFPTGDGHVAELALCGQGKEEGSFVGTVPMTFLPQGGSSLTAEKQVKVTSSTSANRRGVRSGVVKVTLPYTAIMPDGNGGYVTDQSRSGAEMSVHIVVALPATTATDIRSADSAVRTMAEQQLAAAFVVLTSLMQGAIYTPLFCANLSEASSLVAGAHPVALADPDRTSVAAGDADKVEGGGGSMIPSPSGYQTNGGFIMADGYTPFGKAARNLVGRIARNLPALSGCDDVDVVGYHFTPIT